VPLLVAAPGHKAGQRSSKLVESIDIYPTLCELAGLAKPGHLQGQSLVPLLENPKSEWKPFAISRYRTGDTIRTDRFRYSEYSKNGQALGRMLYDHQVDPNENNNIVDANAQAKHTGNLAKRLHVNMGKPSPLKEKNNDPSKNSRDDG
jgi:arylsulfatase A-like enzyme